MYRGPRGVLVRVTIDLLTRGRAEPNGELLAPLPGERSRDSPDGVDVTAVPHRLVGYVAGGSVSTPIRSPGFSLVAARGAGTGWVTAGLIHDHLVARPGSTSRLLLLRNAASPVARWARIGWNSLFLSDAPSR
jgi:hypothetical protein